MAEAVREWLRAQEDAEDAALAAAAMAEEGENIPWDQVKREMRAVIATRAADRDVQGRL